jgi:hypothetical protein
MRAAVSAVLIAGVAAQQQLPMMSSTQPQMMTAPAVSSQGMVTAQAQFNSAPQTTAGRVVMPPAATQPTFNPFATQPTFNPFATQPTYKPLPAGVQVQPTYKPFPTGVQVQPTYMPYPAGVQVQPTYKPLPAGVQVQPTYRPLAGDMPLAQPSTPVTTRGLPIGTASGIQDSDVVCAMNGGVGAACGLQNVPSIYNPNPSLRYNTQYSDNALTLLQATNRYTGTGARVVNPTGNAAWNFGTYDIPTQNGAASGVATVRTNGVPLQQTTNWLNNGALANAVIPSASNAVLPNSVAFQQANLAPWTTTPINVQTGAGFGFSTAQGVRPANLPQAPVPATSLGTSFGTSVGTVPFGSFNTLPSNSFSQFNMGTPLTSWGTPSWGTTSFGASSFGTPISTVGPTSFGSFTPVSGFGTTSFGSYGTPLNSFGTTSFGTIGNGQMFNQPFTNQYSMPGVLGAPSQAGIRQF